MNGLGDKIITAMAYIEENKKQTCCHCLSSARTEREHDDTIEAILEKSKD
jgi:hypothetical protein